ncbi:MAG TPA: DUF3592 domain-containing protein [Steroidobacteraceae bacterium]|nr:DUF3592 domain-containing protein [Steroidobacteraceae bacterium]
MFLVRAVHTSGNVVDLSSINGRCSCGRRCHYDCTKFRAQVSFNTAQAPAALWVSAGSAHGYDCPVTQARYVVGDPVPVAYNPRRPTEAYRDSLGDIWGAPLTTLLFQIFTLIGSFSQRRHGY